MYNTEILSLMSHGEICRFLGRKARKRREFLGLSRAELAKKSLVSVPTISRFELKGVATLSVMVKLAMALGSVETIEPIFDTPKYKTMEDFVKSED